MVIGLMQGRTQQNRNKEGARDNEGQMMGIVRCEIRRKKDKKERVVRNKASKSNHM